MIRALVRTAFFATFCAVVGPAYAQGPLQLASDVFVEREIAKPDGTKAKLLEEPKTVVPGDQLVFVVRYKNVGTAIANNFVVTNPMPRAVRFDGTADGAELVSVDGGKNWGALATLRIAQSNGGDRAATSADVTHLKWNFNQPLSAGAEGKLIFRGVVR